METLPRIRIISAASLLRQPVTGPNWIAAGDAALAFDPLSGLGIYKTIESGLRSSAAIVRCFEGDRSGMVEYENWTAEGFRSYLSMRRQFYGSVERWPGSRFWRRRALLKIPPTEAKTIADRPRRTDAKKPGANKKQ